MGTKKHILVTGGAGYIGSHTVIELMAAGYIPVIIDDFSNSRPLVLRQIEKITGESPEFVEGNCTDKQFLRAVFSSHRFAGVIHFAAYKAVGESVQKPLNYYSNNLGGLLAVLEVMAEFDVSNIVFSSSCTVYGSPDKATAVDEQTPLGIPGSPYGWTKWMCEQILRDAVQANPQLSAVLLRYFNPVGAHESGLIGELPQGVPNNILPYMTQTAAGKLEQLTVFGQDYNTPDGTCIRDYIHVTDLAEAHIRAFDYMQEKPGIATFNIGTGQGTSVLELIKAFEEATGNKLNWKFGPRRPGDVEAIYAAAGYAEKELKWSAKRSITQAVRDSWKWEQKLQANELD